MSAAPILPADDTIGHNSGGDPAAIREEFDQDAKAFLAGADIWAERTELDDATAPRANDFIAGAKKLKARAETARKAEKQPHMDAGKAVDDHWSGRRDRIDRIIRGVQPKLAAYQQRKQAEEDERARLAAQERDRIRAEAEAAALEAASATRESDRIEAEARAEAAQKETAKLERAAAPKAVKIASATGLAKNVGTRTTYEIDITDLSQAVMYFRRAAPEDVAELVRRLAAAEVRAAPTVKGEKQVPTIPGISIIIAKGLAA